MGVEFGFLQSKVNEFLVRNCRELLGNESLLLPAAAAANTREQYSADWWQRFFGYAKP